MERCSLLYLFSPPFEPLAPETEHFVRYTLPSSFFFFGCSEQHWMRGISLKMKMILMLLMILTSVSFSLPLRPIFLFALPLGLFRFILALFFTYFLRSIFMNLLAFSF